MTTLCTSVLIRVHTVCFLYPRGFHLSLQHLSCLYLYQVFPALVSSNIVDGLLVDLYIRFSYHNDNFLISDKIIVATSQLFTDRLMLKLLTIRLLRWLIQQNLEILWDTENWPWKCCVIMRMFCGNIVW